MSFKLSQLLNPAPSPQRSSQPPPPPQQPPTPSQALPSPDHIAAASSWQRPGSSANNAPAVTSAFEAADALTALATSSPPPSHHSYAYSKSPPLTSREQLSPIHNITDARRQSTYGSVATPIEPQPPVERDTILHSPTLEQYHHGSRSPDEQRRTSINSRPSPPPRLAPIQTFPSAFGDQSVGKPQRASAFAHENSYILPPPQTSASSVAILSPNNHNRPVAPEIPLDEPSQFPPQIPSISEPEVQHNQRPPGASIQAQRTAELSSPPPQIKTEPSAGTSRDATPNRLSIQPAQRTPPESIDLGTLKAIEAMKNEHGLRGVKPKPKTETMAPELDAAPAAKKRPAPKTTAATKKGVAKKAPPSKKRKPDTDAASVTNVVSPTAAMRPSPTPSKASKTTAKGGKLSKSNTPALGSSPPPEDTFEDEAEDDAASVDSSDDVFCICRKGDNHTWMIACDGGCEDWFHGKCVKIREEDGDLIDKYICPACEGRGRGFTTWKPMCRLEGCRKPARVGKSNASKYCSDNCGEVFMRLMVIKSNEGDVERKKQRKHRRKQSRTDNIENSLDGGLESDDEDMGPRGGPLRSGEIKALAAGVTDIDTFRRLGDGVLTPPYTSSPTTTTFPNGESKPAGDINGGDEAYPLSYTLQPSERDRIQAIADEKDAMRSNKALLKDRATFVTMAKDQVVRYAERESIKPKDVCGFDSRLSWSDDEFLRWRDSKAGRSALQLQTLEPADIENGADEEGADEDKAAKPQVNGTAETNHDGTDAMDIDGNTPEVSGPKPAKSALETFCARKRCERHKQWQKVTLQTIRFDEMDLGDKMRALEREEREIRERAMLRWRKEVGGKADENTVEVVS